jgi:hypothetical protein
MTKKFYAIAIPVLLLLIIIAIVVRIMSGLVVITPVFLLLVAIIVGAVALLARVKLLKIHWLIRSAEWELMEMVTRSASGTASRVKKQEEKFEYFSRLAKETTNVYAAPAQAGGHVKVGRLPAPPFAQENIKLLDSQDAEMEKVSKRKAKVRLNAALLREMLHGAGHGSVGYAARTTKLTADERALVMGTVEALSKVDSNLVWAAAKMFSHPSKTVEWAPLELRGRKALDYLCSF